MVCSRNVLLLPISLCLVACVFLTQPKTVESLYEGCDSNFSINVGYTYLESPYYPNYYPSGTSCRYIITAPLDHDIQINCSIELEKNADSCSTESFYLSTDGDTQLRGSEKFCGEGSIKRRSIFRTIALAYISNGGYGRFRCSLFAARQPCDCGWSTNAKILYGQDARVNEYPSMVSLHERGSNIENFCGGSILNHRYIVTAAHCTNNQPVASNIEARVGDITLEGTPSRYAATYRIQHIIEHPFYSSNPMQNDIALLQTEQPIEWSRGVGPICLPPPSQVSQSFAYTYVDLVGWGTISFGGPVSSQLKKVNLQVLQNSACARAYDGYAPIHESQVCTYDNSGRSRDSCKFDAGGPVIYRGMRQFLLGVISIGKACGEGGFAIGVNTRITSYLSWIHQYVSVCNVDM